MYSYMTDVIDSIAFAASSSQLARPLAAVAFVFGRATNYQSRRAIPYRSGDYDYTVHYSHEYDGRSHNESVNFRKRNGKLITSKSSPMCNE